MNIKLKAKCKEIKFRNFAHVQNEQNNFEFMGMVMNFIYLNTWDKGTKSEKNQTENTIHKAKANSRTKKMPKVRIKNTEKISLCIVETRGAFFWFTIRRKITLLSSNLKYTSLTAVLMNFMIIRNISFGAPINQDCNNIHYFLFVQEIVWLDFETCIFSQCLSGVFTPLDL